MTRLWYGGGPDDFLVEPDPLNNYALVLKVTTVAVYDAQSGGSQVTDLLDSSATPITNPVVGSDGRIEPFQGPDAYYDDLWLFASGMTTRYRLRPSADGYFSQTEGDARYINITGDTMTGPLTVDHQSSSGSIILDPGPATGSTISQIRWARDGDGALALELAEGQLRFRPLTSSGDFTWTGTSLAILTDGNLSAGKNIIIAGTPSAADHAPRLARTPNPTTGDLGMPGYAGSDTGWRDVSSLLVNGWTASQCQVRRVGATLTVLLQVADPASATDDTLLSGLPTGLSPVATGWIPIAANSGWDTYNIQWNSDGSLLARRTDLGSHTLFGAAQILTDTSWPTSLPGTQVTPPAAW